MDEKMNKETESNKATSCCGGTDKEKNGQWEKPVLKDVSGEIMAQPYIRFT